jgi:hypothetical protein
LWLCDEGGKIKVKKYLGNYCGIDREGGSIKGKGFIYSKYKSKRLFL